jgi:hypothetical protein
VTVTAVGLTLSLQVRAQAPDGRWGTWSGGLLASPGAPELSARLRWPAGEAANLALRTPSARTIEYVEVDDATGRVWAQPVDLAIAADGTASAKVALPALPRGLYWIFAAGDPEGASDLGAAAAARPFVVAESDRDAMALLPDGDCAAGGDDTGAALGGCLASAGAAPVRRRLALDGFVAKSSRRAAKRARGVAISVGAILVTMVLEAALVLRAARRTQLGLSTRLPESRGTLQISTAAAGAVAVSVVLLGLALLAALLLRWA